MKIIYVTGSRAEYGVMKNLLEKIDKDSYFELFLVVTGMHIMKEFGYTIKDIKKDGFKIIGKVDMKLDDNTNGCMAKSIGYGIMGITDIFEKNKSDLVLLAGDRGEMLAAAISAAHLNIPIAHISGGDKTTGATIDEKIRHAITKFADIHFPSNQNSAKTIIDMGANPSKVFPVGNPGIPTNYILDDKRKGEIIKKYKINLSEPLLLVIQHPVTTQVEFATKQMRETMEAIKELKIQSIIVYPNSDAGSKVMIKIIEEYKNLKFINIYKNIVREDFQSLMALSNVIIGNSSCALLEAPSFKLAAVNIGARQEGRERSFNVIDVKHDKKNIIDAVKKAMSGEFKKIVAKSSSPYAKNDAEDKIIKILKNL